MARTDNSSVRCRTQSGAALVLTIFALFVVGTLLSMTLLIGLTEHQIGRNFIQLKQSFSAAEWGLLEPARRWNPAVHNRLRIGETLAFSGRIGAGPGQFRADLTRMNELLFLILAEGSSGVGTGNQRLGALLQIDPLNFTARAALTTAVQTEVDQWSLIDGSDQAPLGWICPPDASSLPAIRVPSADSLAARVVGCLSNSCVRGNPPMAVDSTLLGSIIGDLDGTTLAELKGLATTVISGGSLRVQPTVLNATCITANPTNWGDPYDRSGACGDYFPLVYSTGDLQVLEGRGQGILVVDGDLALEAGVEYDGVVLLTGSLLSNGARVFGAIVAAGASGRPNQILGGTVVRYSGCATRRALVGSGRGFLLRDRGWLIGVEIP